MNVATGLQKKTIEARRAQRKDNKTSVDSVSLWLTCLLAALAVLALAVGAVPITDWASTTAVYAQAGDGASASLSAGYDLTWNTVDGGGVSLTSGGGYTLSGTAGQPDAALWSGGGYTLSGGFWHAGAVTGGTPGVGPVYLPLIRK